MADGWNLIKISNVFANPPVEIEDQDKLESIHETLVEAEDDEWDSLENPIYIQLIGVLYNLSEDLGQREGLDRIIELHTRDVHADFEKVHKAIRHYQLTNAYSLRDSWSENETTYTFFDSDDLIEAIGHARASVSEEYAASMNESREAQSLVNFANILSRAGRVCEALIWYNKAIEARPDHSMALGNRAQCKLHYAAVLFSQSHEAKFLHSAYHDFKKAVENWDDPHPYAKSQFKDRMKSIKKYADDKLDIENEDEYDLGECEFDIGYHRWVLNNNLYLNPLNDIFTHTSTSHDPFHLPDMIIPDDEDFPYPGIYNQMKQEYVSARFTYYEGVTKSGDGAHFSDRDVSLPDPIDYTVYGYHTEQIKTALRMSYSIFDKIAIFINEYFGINQTDPNFSEVWNKNGDYKKGLNDVFIDSNNWPLNALYWIKKDFYNDISKNDEDSIVIVAHELKSIRNTVEHDYIKVFDDNLVSSPPDRTWFSDSIYDAIGRSELQKAAMEMLRISRAALIYLSLAIHHEETKKRSGIDVPTIPVGGEVRDPDEFKQ